MKKKIAIVSGGSVTSIFVKKRLQSYEPDMLIAVDKGLMVVRALGLVPDYAVGDYDSVDSKVLEEVRSLFAQTGKPVIRTYQPEKDATDTEIAMGLALSEEVESILLLGATGTRLDHVFGNIQVLYQALIKGIPAYMEDEHNRIYLADQSFTGKRRDAFGNFFSLIPLTEYVEGITLRGMKYPLEDAELVRGSSLGVSNEIMDEEYQVEFRDGILIVFETRD